MAPRNPLDDFGAPDLSDPSSVVQGLEPEQVDGPAGLPLVKPKGFPDPPDLPDVSGNSPWDY